MKIAPLPLIVSLLVSLNIAAQVHETPFPVISAEKAIHQRKRLGEYDSLKLAIKATRQGIGTETSSGGMAEQPAGQPAKVVAPDGAADDFFGISVAISGDTAIIGAYADDVGENIDQGSAYIFVREGTTWIQQQKLTATDGSTGDRFGISVDLSGDTAIVGAYADGVAGQGSAYIFVRTGTTWTLQQKLVASDGSQFDYFGYSVAMAGDTAVVGAYGDSISGHTGQGSAYIFIRSGITWSQQQKLTVPDGATVDAFGFCVAISDETAIVGALGADIDGNIDQGSAYIFVREGTTWIQQQKLTATDGSAGDRFGISVDLSGDTTVIGANGDDIGGNSDQGSAYVFVRAGVTWTQQQKLTATDGMTDDRFGYGVTISGSTVVVGSNGNDVGGNTDQGSAYIYAKTGMAWTSVAKVADSAGEAGDSFGSSVGIFGDRIIVGAPNSDAPGLTTISDNPAGSSARSATDQGSAMLFVNDFPSASGNAPVDFDGDGKTDISIYRSSLGQWWYQRSSDAVVNVFQFGVATDKLVPGDYTGDGKTDIAVWRPSNGNWYVLRSEDNTFFAGPFGANGDIPAPGDFDGDGKSDLAVFRPTGGNWFILNSSNSSVSVLQFGLSTDKPVVADYDGDSKADVAIWRPSLGQWWMHRSNDGSDLGLQFGESTDHPVQGDYTGDGKADVAIWRPSNGNWYILRSEDLSFFAFPFGASGDIPVPGDYDGDGKQDAGVYRPSAATWFVNRTTGGVLTQQFGNSTDTPVPSAFVR